MIGLRRFLWALAALGMLMLTVLAPSAASAHSGHDHKASVETRSEVAKVGTAAMQEVRAADVAVRHVPQGQDGCDRGCCGNGHCAGCVMALAPTTGSEFDRLAGLRHSTLDAALPPGLGTDGPSRPPRPFV